MKITKDKILLGVKQYILDQDEKNKFIPGETYVRTSGAMWDEEDVASLVDTALGRWYTDSTNSRDFERLFSAAVKQRYTIPCNSGSSANLLAISALKSEKLGKRRLKDGDEVIVVAAGFPTTLNPVIQNNLIPVFVDISLPSYNALPHAIEEAVSEKTRAIIIAHTLGNPYKAEAVKRVADRNDLFLIADCCDALGAEYMNQPLPFYAHMSTFSFYPAHHISMGEGGAVCTDSPMLNKIVRSFRDWGRDCWCETGKDNTCGKRFNWQLGDLPHGFDHKYTYSEVGYNLKITDLQASLGLSQIKKLSTLVEARRDNWNFYRSALSEYEEFLLLPEPTPKSKPSWFGFLISVKDKSPFTRNELVQYLESKMIGTRMLFGGNLTKHPAYKNVQHRISGTLHKSDYVMNNTFWIGVSPVVTRDMQVYVANEFNKFMGKYK